jgi:hypothetical protein
MNASARVAVLLAAALSGACGARLMNLPSGPGSPATDGGPAVAEATQACGTVASLAAEVAVTGRVGGQRLRARLHAGVASPSSARLEAVAPFGQPLFIFVAYGGAATLLLTRENRVLRDESPAAVLEAIAGVPLDPAGLRAVLTGCAAGTRPDAARQVGDGWRLVPAGDGEVYLRRESGTGRWRLVATIHREPGREEWRAEYHDFADGLPRTIRLVSSDAARFSLRLAVSDVDLNLPLGPEAFELRIPASAEPITLDELRRSGPLAELPATATARAERDGLADAR